MKNIFLTSALLSLTLTSCNQPVPAAVQEDVNEYILTDVKGHPDAKFAEKKDGSGNVIEKGNLVNGVKNGTWLYFERKFEFPKKSVTYVDGLYNGPYLEFSQNGTITIMANYQNNKLHGKYTSLRFGRPVIDCYYVDGTLDGPYKEYDGNNGKIKKEMTYKNGKLDGEWIHYGANEEVVMKYVYKNGEKVEGEVFDIGNDGANEPQ